MKKITSLQIVMLMGLAVGSLNMNASDKKSSEESQRWGKQGSCKNHEKSNRNANKMVIMGEEEHMMMQDIVDAAHARIAEEMGKNPTEHSIKRFIHSVVEEFKMSRKDSEALENALFKLSDARVAIRKFNEKLEAVDKHNVASTHMRSLKRKLKDARMYVKEHAQQDNLAEIDITVEPAVVMDDNDGSEEVMIQSEGSQPKKKKHMSQKRSSSGNQKQRRNSQD